MTVWLTLRAPVDRLVAAALLLVAAPVVAVLSVLVRRQDGAVPMIALERVGRGGRRFRLWKIRTMRPVEADGSAGGASLTSGDDERITPIGHRLRRLRADELPQLWNVVRGDMALIGPRPEAPAYVDCADPRWRPVLQVRPGIVGPTQLVVHKWEAETLRDADADAVYRDDVLPVKLRIDAWYACNASPAIDVAVLADLVGFLLGRPPRRVLRRLPKDSVLEFLQASS